MVLSHILMKAYLIEHFLADLMTIITEKNQDKSFNDYMSKTLRDKSKIQKINNLSKNTSISSHVFSVILLKMASSSSRKK